MNKTCKAFPALTFLLVVISCSHESPRNTWAVYRGDQASNSYSSLDQINKDNVNRLEVAWVYHTGNAREENRSTIQCNPIIVNGMLYATSPKLKLLALDPESGHEKWKFDPFKDQEPRGVNRGVAYWSDDKDKRIFLTAGPYLYAINADSGTVIPSFGDQGKVDLRVGLGRDPAKLSVAASSPGTIYKDLLIQGTALGEGYDAAPGFIRAYHVRTGAIAWTFHTIPQPGEFGYETWDKEAYRQVGGVNCWTGMSIDSDRGIVFIPLGSPAFDFYGGNRKGQNLFGNCLLALNAQTGERKWHFQLVHHDLWDYDPPAPPTLITVERDGEKVDAVAQVTKTGMVYVFDRETGSPLFPIEERAVPESDLPGEETWPTQPFPVKPPPFVRQEFSENEITDVSPEHNAFVKEKVKSARRGGMFTPPSTDGLVQFPGTRGGAEWGGPSFDPLTGILYVNANELPALIKMSTAKFAEGKIVFSPGERIYRMNNCAACHASNRAGNKNFPSLQDLSKRLTEKQVASLLKTGKGQMPAFPALSGKEMQALIDFLLDKKESEVGIQTVESDIDIRYVNDGWNPLTDQDGHPGVKPPWGTLNAIDLNRGEILWKVTLGEYPDLIETGLPPTGTPNLGGPVNTAGGLIFIAATEDEKFRAFDKETGNILWEYKLPAGGYATPATYLVNGKQYIVIAAGGGGLVGSPSGDAYVAFSLKE